MDLRSARFASGESGESGESGVGTSARPRSFFASNGGTRAATTMVSDAIVAPPVRATNDDAATSGGRARAFEASETSSEARTRCAARASGRSARRGGRLGGFHARHDTRGGGPVPVTRDENARVRPRRRYVNVKYTPPGGNDATGRVDRFRSFVNVSCAYRYYYTSWTMLNGDARGSSSAYPTFERSSKVGHRRERLSRRSILHLVTVP